MNSRVIQQSFEARIFPDSPSNSDLSERPTTGTLPSQYIDDLIRLGHIQAETPIRQEQIQPASLDLRLSSVAYRVRASFLPGRSTRVAEKLETVADHAKDLTQPCVLEKGCVFIIPLQETLNLRGKISARANPKSTVGRLDVFTRLIADYSDEFERVPNGYQGKLYLEVSPRTFSIEVEAGSMLHQLRFVRGSPPPSDAELHRLHQEDGIVYHEDGSPADPTVEDGLWIRVDLAGDSSDSLIGFRAKQHAPSIALGKRAEYDPIDYWEPVRAGDDGHLLLNPDDYYLLRSQEHVSIPPEYAAAMVPYDPAIGEFRVHYAGFFDPGFGWSEEGRRGTPAVLEVRSHDVPFLLEDGQRVGCLLFERLLARPSKVYGAEIGSSYQNQGLSLSKQFKSVHPSHFALP